MIRLRVTMRMKASFKRMTIKDCVFKVVLAFLMTDLIKIRVSKMYKVTIMRAFITKID